MYLLEIHSMKQSSNRFACVVISYDITSQTRFSPFELVSWWKFDECLAHSLENSTSFHFSPKLIFFSKPVKTSLGNKIPCFVIRYAKKTIIKITTKDDHISFSKIRLPLVRIGCSNLLGQENHHKIRDIV